MGLVCLMFLAAVTAAMSSALAEQSTVPQTDVTWHPHSVSQHVPQLTFVLWDHSHVRHPQNRLALVLSHLWGTHVALEQTSGFPVLVCQEGPVRLQSCEMQFPKCFVACKCPAVDSRQLQWNSAGFEPNFDIKVMTCPASDLQLACANIILPGNVQ